MKRFVVIVGLGLLVSASCHTPLASAQGDIAPCGYVDEFDFPVPDIDIERTDFGIYRAQYGGMHTGMDIAFQQLGAPVRAAARGRVTYSDTEGWDTEKGVVVIQHTMPDGTLVNSLYGHMEELNDYTFPPTGQCVERGDIIGAVGDPSLSAPHLHYEIRTRYRYEGGPGYTDVSPLELGWLNPVDFTMLARVWILPAYRDHFTLTVPATQPPLRMPDGTYVIAHNATLEGIQPDGQILWQFDVLGSVTGLVALPDGRVLASTSENQILVLNQGSYNALWTAPKAFTSAPLLLSDTVIVISREQTLMAFTPDGTPLWETPPLPGRVNRWAISSSQLAVTTDTNALWIVDANGTILAQNTFPDPTIPFARSVGEFTLLSGSTIYRIDEAHEVIPLVDTGRPVTADAELAFDETGTLYLYTGEGRAFYAYTADGSLLWIGYMPGSHLRPPILGIGGGSLIYALTADGQLLAFAAMDGHLVAQTALYNGGIDGSASTRWLAVDSDDTVRFGSGFLSAVTLDGLELVSP